MNPAYNIEEARNFFLENSSGRLVCVSGRSRTIVNTYPDAVKWFNSVRTPKML